MTDNTTDRVRNLQDHLRDQGRHLEADSSHQCPKCRLHWPAFTHKDVRDNDLIQHDFICGQCHLQWVREMNAVWGWLNEPAVDWSHVNALKRSYLNSTMWATATDGTVDPAYQKQMLDWRRSIAAIGPQTHEHPSHVIWPAMPQEPSE